MINKIISVIALILTTVLMVLISYLNLIPFKYYILVLLVILVFNLINIIFAFKFELNQVCKTIQLFLSIILSLISIFGSFYLAKTINFMNGIETDGYVTENYSAIVLKDSLFTKLEDLKSETIGVLINDTKESKVVEYLKSKLNFQLKENNDIVNLKEALYNKTLDCIVIEDSYRAILEELDGDFINNVNIIHTFSLDYESQDISKDVNITEDPFVIYISGIDTYGKISSVSRSDVNMVAVVNPKTYQVLLISIPRDYYVQLHGAAGNKDKLTHAGIYGIDTSVKTIEDLLDTNINYYLKVNFTSLIDIVNALGGLEVYSEYFFESEGGYYFHKGYNRVNGHQALAFARERHAFKDGDRQRGKNQQAVIEAVVRKAASKVIITKYDALLEAINGKFQTNLETKQITSLAKLQIDKMPKWTIKSISLNGTDASDYTYTYGSEKLYVMLPDDSSINEAKKYINMVVDGEELDSSYGDVSNVKNPGIIEVKPEPPKEELNSPAEGIISLSSDNVTVKVGEIVTLTAKTTITGIINWNSSNPDVVIVDASGKLTPIKAGSSTISATVNNQTAICTVTVKEPLDSILPDEPAQEKLESTIDKSDGKNPDINQETFEDNQNYSNDNVVEDNPSFSIGL